MLIILFGSTGKMGKWSREYFIDRGYELINKYNYVPEDHILKERYGKRELVSRERAMSCDFTYENNGMIVGFNKEQIIDAVRGRKKCLITTSSETIDFVREIKAAYGDYVTVIGTYIDDQTLRKIFSSFNDTSPEEIEERLQIGKGIKKNLINDRKLFDNIVIFGGESSSFGMRALEVQYDFIIEKAEKREKELNDRMYVEMPYTGSEDYVFISYSHKDTEKVFPVLRMLQLNGCRVWYDEGIRGGDNWRKILAFKIQSENCRDVIVFSSENSVKSRHVLAEINAALNCDKKITAVRMDSAEFELDTEMYLQTYQNLFADASDFSSRLLASMTETVKIKGKE